MFGVPRWRFPSPYGVFVFLHPNSNPQLMKWINSQFPSPYGVFVFLLSRREKAIAKFNKVSVPLRGFCFFTLMEVIVMFGVPRWRFPSPFGVFVFLH